MLVLRAARPYSDHLIRIPPWRDRKWTIMSRIKLALLGLVAMLLMSAAASSSAFATCRNQILRRRH